MQRTLSTYFALVGIAIFCLGLWSLSTEKTDAFSSVAGSGCNVVSTTTINIGNQTATTIVASAANNAYVLIQQPVNATNTVALGLGANASLTGSGIKLAPGGASTSPDSQAFGLNAPMPYTGSVSAITNLGSTTLGVTICRYN
jgi:hypothetical protein